MTLSLSLGLGLTALRQSGGVKYDPDALTYFSRMDVQPDKARKQLVSDMFAAGKVKSFWAKLDALWIHAAHDAQAARLNWISSNYDCLTVNSPAFTVDRGYMGDGIASYINTQFNPATAVGAHFVLASASLGIRSNTNNAGAGSLAGFYDSSNGTTINPRDASDRSAGRINGTSIAQTSEGYITSSVGMYVTNVVPGSQKIFKDGVAIASVAPVQTTLASGALRLGSISASSFRACQFSMGFIGSGLTDQEAQDIYDWFEPYRIAVGL